jgi:hypothetical protein
VPVGSRPEHVETASAATAAVLERMARQLVRDVATLARQLVRVPNALGRPSAENRDFFSRAAIENGLGFDPGR